MTTVLTRIREIADKEGFDIWDIKHKKKLGKGGSLVKVSSNGLLGKYDFDKRLKGTKTVSKWIKERFEASYPGFTCIILNGDGSEAKMQTKLETVRQTYED